MKCRYGLSATVVFALVMVTTSAALAAPMEATISLGRDPEPPICVQNPGGIIDITWNIAHTTTPNYVYYKLEDPTRTVVLEEETYPGGTGVSVSRQWTVPAGSFDGKYWIRVEYWSYEAGNEANAEVTFYVCTDTGGISATKLQDVDRDGDCDEDVPIESWWVCIKTPFNDTYCKQTNSSGIVSWDNLITGDYRIFEPAVTGWSPVGPDYYDVTVTSGVTERTFCNYTQETRGACCGPWGTSACIQAYENWCINQGGIFMGEGTTCGGNICATPVVPKTWGSIKAMYR